jgi:D-alanyl-lipoteichoic acid acyltransferase DltB (MBOAT superfamily)
VLRVDSFEFVGVALLLVGLLRCLPRSQARAAYALVSWLVYVALAPNWPSLLLSLAFVHWPWLFITRLRPPPSAAIPVLITVQTVLLLWVRKYFSLVPPLAATPLVAHALVIVGASYIILRQVELVLLVDAEPEVSVPFVEYTAFSIGFFTLLAGPIAAYQDFERGFVASSEREDAADWVHAANRVVNGYLKVSLLSPILFQLSSFATLRSAEQSWAAWALCFYLFPLYIYVNFSGYCDVVIGFGKLGRIELPENFDHPYLATNIQAYWQRWHLTFSHWIRNYLFFPLVHAFRGSRAAVLRALGMPLAVLVTFVIVGLWHGTDPGFAIFGLLHGLGVLVVAPYTKLLDRTLSPKARARYESSPALRALRMAACYHYLCFSMLFFERPLSQLYELLRAEP